VAARFGDIHELFRYDGQLRKASESCSQAAVRESLYNEPYSVWKAAKNDIKYQRAFPSNFFRLSDDE
jgi:hypothetical protein